MGIGGAETMLVDIANEQSLVDDVTIVIINEHYDKALLEKLSERVKVVRLGRKPGNKNPWYIVKLNYIIGKLKPDVIHAHQSNVLKMLLPSFLSKTCRTVHDLHINLSSVRKVKHIAISDAVGKDIASRYPEAKVVVVPNGINCDSITGKRYHGKQSKTLRIVQVARLDHLKKGQDLLLKALAILKQKGITDIIVDFIGEGDSENFLHAMASELGIESQVRFLGLRDRSYIYSHLADYDIMCHPARYEGFGLVIAEGIVAGLPVIVSDSGGPAEIIEHGRYGLMFKHGDAESLAGVMLNAYDNYDDLRQNTEIARRHVVDHYTIRAMVKEYRNCYISL